MNDRIPEYRVLFVTKTGRINAPYLDPSVRYRCFNPAEVFSARGIKSDVLTQDKLEISFLDNYDAFVFHRPDASEAKVAMFVELARVRGKTVVADYDDLIFAPEYALQSSIFLNGNATEDQVEAIFKRNFKGFSLFDAFTVSTEPLAEQVRKLKPQARVLVVPNGLSRRLLDIYPAPSLTAERRLQMTKKVFSYLSGTASHVPDIAYVAEAMAEFLSAHREARFAIGGPIKLPDVLLYAPGIVRQPYREFVEFFSSAASFYANIAPLAPGSVFNNCKSGLKFFESGIWGVPTIASPIADFKRFADSPGLILAESPEEWRAAFERLMDADEYRRAAAGLRDYCRAHCMADEPAMRQLAFLQKGE